MSKMTLKVLFLHYRNESEPSAVLVTDQFTEAGGFGDYFAEQCQDRIEEGGDELVGHAVVEVDVDLNTIIEACRPKTVRVEGEVRPNAGEGQG